MIFQASRNNKVYANYTSNMTFKKVQWPFFFPHQRPSGHFIPAAFKWFDAKLAVIWDAAGI